MAIYAEDIDVNDAVEKILQIYRLATQDEIEAGRTWYQRAHDFAEALATCYRSTTEKTAGIIAALSPACSWERNMIDATRLLENGRKASVATYGQNKTKALKILYGNTPAADHLGDLKTDAFYRNIVSPDRATRVTVDRHAVRAAIDYGMTAEEAIYYCNTPNKYARIEEAYTIAAERENMLPHQLQAIVWLTYRRLFVRKGQLQLFHDF